VALEDEQKAPKHLLSLLGETDRLMSEVQTVLRRIGVELERLGISQGALPDPSRPEACAELDSLSSRESEVAQLLLEGDRVSSIARGLFISRHTVRNHLQSIYRKLGVGSQAELIEKLKGSTWPGRARRGEPARRVGGSPYRLSGRCECLSHGHREFPRGTHEPHDVAG
jgi:DNA-binding CsgD family transcriptional regulator